MTQAASPGKESTAALDAWLSANVAGVTGPFSLTLIAGGRSNLTYVLADAQGRRMVLRRPPFGHILHSAHDVVREYRIISALQGRAPVAPTLAACDDRSVLGAPFYVMEFVDGLTMREEGDVEMVFDEAGRARLSEALIDALADIHRLEPVEVGLDRLATHGNYAVRQLHRWRRQFDAARTREVPEIHEAHRRLEEIVPAKGPTRIVHGDFRLDNCLIGPDAEVRAVLDWELCTLGDPLADLGLLMVYWTRPGDAAQGLLTGSATMLPGFLEREALVARYVDRTGADVSSLLFYTALGYWKLACIFEGIAGRYANGVMGDDQTAGDRFASQAVDLGEAALAILDQH